MPSHTTPSPIHLAIITITTILCSLCNISCHRSGSTDDSSLILASRSDYSVHRPYDLPDKLQIPLKPANNYLLVQGHVNNEYAGQFLFDTGAAISGVELGVAGRLNLPRYGQGTASGIGGQATISFCRIDNFAIHNLELNDNGRFAALNMLGFTRTLEMPLSGIVGYTALGNRVPFCIDQQNNVLTVYNPVRFQPPVNVEPVRLHHHHRLPMVSAEIGDDHPIWLVLDTGADNQLSLPQACTRLWPDILAVPFQGPARTTGIGGEVVSSQAWLVSLKLFGLDLRDVPVTFEPHIETLARYDRPVGRIGNELLKHFRLTFQPNRQKIWAQWTVDEER